MVALIDKEGIPTSQIQEYFAGSCVFITGATGFLGKLLFEKILRCTDTKKVFILVREKRGKAVEKRLEEILDNVIFSRIKEEQPTFTEKIVLLTGDCVLPDLGLSQSAKQKLINEVNCIFHCAATVRFDEKIRTAVNVNIRATRDLLNLSRKMKHLSSFIYVSTAFSHCTRKEIDEIFYEPIITGDQIVAVVNNMNEELLEKITPTLLDNWPNSYALSKAVSEDIIKVHGQGLPVAVVRPSIVIATASEPIPGWIDNFYGPTGTTVGSALGLIHTIHCKENCTADLVPADYVINCTISAAWEVGTTSQFSKLQELSLGTVPDCFSDNILKTDTSSTENGASLNEMCDVSSYSKTKREIDEIRIYNYVSSNYTRLTWRTFTGYAERHLPNFPSPLTLWHYFLILNSYYFCHVICAFLLHTIPAYIVDLILICIGKKPMAVKGYRKIHKLLDALSYFSTREWKFQNHNIQVLWKKLNSADRKIFDFDLSDFDWDPYFYSFAIGGRVYLLKDPLDTIPQGRVKYMRLKIAHYVVVVLLLIVLYKLLSVLWNAII